MSVAATPSPDPKRVFVLGGTGTIGQAAVAALLARGHHVTCFLRPRASDDRDVPLPDAATLRFGDVTDPASLIRDGFRGDRFDALVSCMASRSGTPRDAWAIDHKAHVSALGPARGAGITHVVLLSAICVQKPRLAFQQAKLAAEQALIASGLTYSIVRPTAFFKSLSGQVARLRAGKPFLLFGDGALTACKPISDADLGRYIATCLDDADRQNRILPIGGPGPAITPRQQGEMLFRLLGQDPRFRHVPVGMMDAIIAGLGALGRLSPKWRDKAELARIGRYYATESMLLLDPVTGRYDAEATPEFGTDTLEAFYASLIRGEVSVDLGDHAVF
ncbi:divinylchlorophyllide 8-vinylreductase [Roseovarius litoreus]|uniref:Divinyl chlorophyllide a 8-vinyl-reductase, chloroplastic n=1 Tax=Roseovarius litoreus TaxID=1155722 RepID=A0A1M7B0D3_9RHOB|nr:NAD(P)H-binding protein [Roseovarius litoreus]SHL48404.1 divinylchlorophyllide 8-vinylreductase [Roseovarius litoreus]